MPPGASVVSCRLQSAEPGLDELLQDAELLLQVSAAVGRQAVGPPPVARLDATNPAALFEPSDRSVQRARTESDTGEGGNVVHHRVAVLVAVGQAREHEESWVHQGIR